MGGNKLDTEHEHDGLYIQCEATFFQLELDK